MKALKGEIAMNKNLPKDVQENPIYHDTWTLLKNLDTEAV